MHELAITESVVEQVTECVGAARVVRLVLEVGALTAVVPDAIRFCFEVCARATPCENATLEIVVVDGHGVCNACGDERAVSELASSCACGSFDVQITRGQDLRVREVEVRGGD
jgi:hydrogenase nickel incorporation protein HypA/HybF